MGFDWVRALASVLVVMWHMVTLPKPHRDSNPGFIGRGVGLIDVVNFNIILLAVPLFIMMSCYLFARSNPDRQRLRKTLRRIGFLAVFWAIAYNIYLYGSIAFLRRIPRAPYDLFIYAIQAGSTIYYFFISLMVCIVITYFLRRLNHRAVVGYLSLASIVTFGLPLLAIKTGNGDWAAYWNPLNFLAYPAAAVLIQRRNRDHQPPRKNRVWLVILGLVVIAAATIEWSFLRSTVFHFGRGYAPPSYGRVSLLASSAMILIICSQDWISSNRWIDYLSKTSLALYCLHPFFLHLGRRVQDADWFSFVGHRWIALILVIVTSNVSYWILLRVLNRRLLN